MELEAYGHNKISIHALREEGDCSVTGASLWERCISIHALREEGDPRKQKQRRPKNISIHALREEGDLDSWHYGDNYTISIHALREEGDHAVQLVAEVKRISIHALREEGDPVLANIGEQAILFLSTPSARRATSPRPAAGSLNSNFYPRPPRGGRPEGIAWKHFIHIISIHALREEGDRLQAGTACKIRHFYPRPPRGGRPATHL